MLPHVTVGANIGHYSGPEKRCENGGMHVMYMLCLPYASQSVDKEILDILPKIKEAKNIVKLMDRDTLTFDVALQRTEDEVSFAHDGSNYIWTGWVPYGGRDQRKVRHV